MKKLLFLLCVLSCAPAEKKKPTPTFAIDFKKSLEGNIYGKPFKMELESLDGKIVGYYHYEGARNERSLDGKIESGNKVILNEYDDEGNMTGKFDLVFHSENRLEGVWSKPNGTSEKDVRLLATNVAYKFEPPKRQEVKPKEPRVAEPQQLHRHVVSEVYGTTSKGQSQQAEEEFMQEDVIGFWKVRMTVVESDCKGTKKGTVNVERWKVEYRNNTYYVKPSESAMRDNTYEGKFVSPYFNVYNSYNYHAFFGKKDIKTKIALQMLSKTKMEGTRIVSSSIEKCKTNYFIELEKE